MEQIAVQQMVRSIRLYGSLGAKFGREHRYVVQSPRDALRALGAMIPGFWQELYRSGERGLRYAVFVGQRNVSEAQLDWPAGSEPIRIAPIITGSKAGGLFQTIAGVALAAAGAASLFFDNPYGINMMLTGGSLALGGIAQMLSPQTPTPPAKNQHGMPGIQNVVAQGGPVPLLYGRMRVGSTVISTSVQAVDAPARGGLQACAATRQTPDEIEEQKNTPLNSRLTCTVVDLIAEGEIGGLANNIGPIPPDWFPLYSVYLDDVRVLNDGGSRNFQVDKFDFRSGAVEQQAVDWVTAAANETPVGVELRRHLADIEENGKTRKVTQFTPWLLEVAEPDVDEVDVTLQVSDLWWDSNKGHTNASVKFRFSPSYVPAQKDTPAPVPEERKIAGTCQAYYKTFTFPVSITGGARFRLTLTRTDEIDQGKNAGKEHGTVHVVSYTKRRTGKFKYPASALAALQISSEKFERVPVRSYEVKGLLVNVPRNYDPQTRKYDGTWDGTFKRAWTDNPVWIFRDVLLNRRYGAGAWVRPEMVDPYSLYAIGRYCDELVPNCAGGTEPRFTCNCYITSRTHAFALLQQLASVFRGIAYWSAEHVWGSADMPSDPVYVYNPANVVNGIFKYTGSSLKSRYTAAMVTWCDPLDGHKRAVESVEDVDGIALYGYNAAEFTAFGCTSRGQAQRAGHWLLQTSRLETETVTFSVGLDGTLALPGQIIEIADPLRSDARSDFCSGGRIREASGARVVLDREVEAQPGDCLTVVLPDARARRVEIAGVRGATVDIASPLEQVPVRGAAWSVRSGSATQQRYRVVSVSEAQDGTSFSITATRYAPEKFAAVDNAAITNEIHHAYVPIAPPANVKIQAVAGPEAKMAAKISWDLVDGAKQYHLEWYAPNGEVTKSTAQSGDRESMFHDVKPGAYTVKTYAEAWDSRLSTMVQSACVLRGLVYVKDAGSVRVGGVVAFNAELEYVCKIPEFLVEIRLGETRDFRAATDTAWGRKNDSIVSVSRGAEGYAWLRVRYGTSSVNPRERSESEWFPRETQAGIHFG